jgi:hypothetical protein
LNIFCTLEDGETIDFKKVGIRMRIPMVNAEFCQEMYHVDDPVFAYPSLKVLRGSDLDHAICMEGIILGINTDGTLEIGFYIGPMPYDVSLIQSLLLARYNGSDVVPTSQGTGSVSVVPPTDPVEKQRYPSVARSIWALATAQHLLNMPLSARDKSITDLLGVQRMSTEIFSGYGFGYMKTSPQRDVNGTH